MNSHELRQKLSDAKQNGYYECRFDEYYHDVSFVFSRELRKGYELISVDYPANDQDRSYRFPRAKFKFNEAMEKDMQLQIKQAEAQERHSAILSQLNKEESELLIKSEEDIGQGPHGMRKSAK